MCCDRAWLNQLHQTLLDLHGQVAQSPQVEKKEVARDVLNAGLQQQQQQSTGFRQESMQHFDGWHMLHWTQECRQCAGLTCTYSTQQRAHHKEQTGRRSQLHENIAGNGA